MLHPGCRTYMSNWLFYRHECPMHIVFPLGFPMKWLLLQKWMAKPIRMPIQLPSKFRVRNYQRHRRAASGINVQRFGSASQNQRQRRSWINTVDKWSGWSGWSGRSGWSGMVGTVGVARKVAIYTVQPRRSDPSRFRSNDPDPTNTLQTPATMQQTQSARGYVNTSTVDHLYPGSLSPRFLQF